MIKIFAALVLLFPIFLLYKMTIHSLDNDYDNAAVGFGFSLVFAIGGYFLMIFNLFGVGF